MADNPLLRSALVAYEGDSTVKLRSALVAYEGDSTVKLRSALVAYEGDSTVKLRSVLVAYEPGIVLPPSPVTAVQDSQGTNFAYIRSQSGKTLRQ